MTENLLSKKIAIAEIFSSIQGEGPRMGEKHLFVRFPACNLHCAFCDEMHHQPKEITVGDLLRETELLEEQCGPHALISLTGGEPLLYHGIINEIVPVLKAKGFRFLLETAGVHVAEFREVVRWIDVVSMDMKLPSVTKDRAYFSEHAEFLKLSLSRDVYVKIVVSREADYAEFMTCVRIIKECAPSTLLVLQPMTEGATGEVSPKLLSYLYALQAAALREIPNVRIMPRLHKILGVP